jgi:hypothetical protein
LIPPTFLSKTQKSYFCLCLFLISNSFFAALIVTLQRSRVGRRCQFRTQIFWVGIFWSRHSDPWANTGLVRDKRMTDGVLHHLYLRDERWSSFTASYAASGNLSHLRSNVVGCCNSIITVFHHEHFGVLLRKGKYWYAFLIFIFSLM